MVFLIKDYLKNWLPEKNYFKDFDYNPRKIIDTSNYWIRAQEIINEDKNIKIFQNS